VREKQINLKLSPDEDEKLEKMAKRLGLTKQEVLRMLLRQAPKTPKELKIR
jgi:hypothetical protein